MLQRWMKPLVVIAASTVLFTACKKEYSKDEPLPEEFKPSLFISSQNEFLYALEPKTGNKIWEYYIKKTVTGTPAIIGDFMFIPTPDSLIKLDAKRGKVVKKYFFGPAHDFKNFPGSPTVGPGNMLYIGSDNDTVYALSAADDQIKWKFAASSSITTAPMLVGNQLLVSAGGTLYSLNAQNGSADWSFNGGKFTSPAVSGNTVYVGSADGNVYAIDLKLGTQRWSYPTGGIIESSAIVFGGNVIIGSNDNYLYCIDTAAKKERWKFKTNDRVISSPVSYGQTVYFGSYDYYFYALNIIDGTQKWKYQTKKLIKSSPVVYDGAVYVGSYDKNMYAFDTSGYLLWSRQMDGVIESSPIVWDLTTAFYPSIMGL